MPDDYYDPKVFPPITDGLPTWDSSPPPRAADGGANGYDPDPLDVRTLSAQWATADQPVEKRVDTLLRTLGRLLVIASIAAVFAFFFYLLVMNAPART